MDVYAVIGGAVNALTGTGLYLAEHDGLGDFPVDRVLESGPLQNGATDLGWQGLVRRFVLAFDTPYGASARYTERTRLRRLFAPQNNLALRFVLPNGDARQIDCRRLDAPLPAQAGGYNGRLVYRFVAAAALLYDPVAVAVSFALGGGSDALVIPMTVPMVVGASTLDTTQAVTYTGDADSYPALVRITGPITNCVMTNNLSAHKLDFTGVTIAAGDYYDIDCRYGDKTIVDSDGDSQIDDLTDDSDLAEFRLLAPVDGSGSRVNTFRVTGSSVTAATKVEMTYYTQFGGI